MTQPTQELASTLQRKARSYLTPQELSDRWDNRIKAKTLANWRSDPAAPGPTYRRFGNRILYPIPDVEQWEARNAHASTRN